MQFEEDPTDRDFNYSDVHVYKIMNAKIGPEVTNSYSKDKGDSLISAPGTTISAALWREQYSRKSKIFESCFCGD